MKADFSRITFKPNWHYSRVLMQQGRVLLDSDWNEQAAIFNHYFQTLARDLIGRYGGPKENCGFEILEMGDTTHLPVELQAKSFKNIKNNFWIGPGRYYVDGLLCENNGFKLYAPPDTGPGVNQSDFIPEPEGLAKVGAYLVYLDVWERHVTALEEQAIREVALGPQGPDTATRAKVVVQVKTIQWEDIDHELGCLNSPDHVGWNELIDRWQPLNRGLLQAKADEPDDISATNPCIISPDARYRGAENQLYRVEIHQGGPADSATFKWSRENGSVALPIRIVSGQKVTLEHMGRDERFGLQVGDWVEIEGLNFETADGSQAPPLLQVQEVNYIDMYVMLSGAPDNNDPGRVLRRWDQKEGDKLIGGLELRNGAALVKEGSSTNENWLTLEDGVQIQFQEAPAPGQGLIPKPHNYRRGDYWLIPARTATGDVEWPGPLNAPEAIPPHGVQHHYAPLARITVGASEVTVDADVRRKFSLQIDCVNGGGA